MGSGRRGPRHHRLQRLDPGHGQVVKIQHSNGFITLYAHNQKNLVEVGGRRGRADRYGGAQRHATGPHVQFEIRRDGRSQPAHPLEPSDQSPAFDDDIAASSLSTTITRRAPWLGARTADELEDGDEPIGGAVAQESRRARRNPAPRGRLQPRADRVTCGVSGQAADPGESRPVAASGRRRRKPQNASSQPASGVRPRGAISIAPSPDLIEEGNVGPPPPPARPRHALPDLRLLQDPPGGGARPPTRRGRLAAGPRGAAPLAVPEAAQRAHPNSGAHPRSAAVMKRPAGELEQLGTCASNWSRSTSRPARTARGPGRDRRGSNAAAAAGWPPCFAPGGSGRGAQDLPDRERTVVTLRFGLGEGGHDARARLHLTRGACGRSRASRPKHLRRPLAARRRASDLQ